MRYDEVRISKFSLQHDVYRRDGKRKRGNKAHKRLIRRQEIERRRKEGRERDRQVNRHTQKQRETDRNIGGKEEGYERQRKR